MTAPEQIEKIFAATGCTGWLHARDIDSDGQQIDVGGDAPVVAASVFKIFVLLELFRCASAGELDPAERITVPASRRSLGPTGISVMKDDVDLSLRDLAYLMMSVSDNTATDVLMERLGLDAINATVAGLGLKDTHLIGDCKDLLGSFTEDVGSDLGTARVADIDPDRVRAWRSLDPTRTTRTTPREATDVLARIWRDEAAPPDACAEMRRIMSQQVWPHRLTSGFPSGVLLAAKTGTLPGIRNEAGVATYPDGGRYAVAVFTRSHTLDDRQPAVDAAIGITAHLAVEALRAQT